MIIYQYCSDTMFAGDLISELWVHICRKIQYWRGKLLCRSMQMHWCIKTKKYYLAALSRYQGPLDLVIAKWLGYKIPGGILIIVQSLIAIMQAASEQIANIRSLNLHKPAYSPSHTCLLTFTHMPTHLHTPAHSPSHTCLPTFTHLPTHLHTPTYSHSHTCLLT